MSTYGAEEKLATTRSTFLDLCLKKIRKDTAEIKKLYDSARQSPSSETLTHLLPWTSQERDHRIIIEVFLLFFFDPF